MRPFSLRLTGPGLAIGLASSLALARPASPLETGPAPATPPSLHLPFHRELPNKVIKK